MLFLKPVRCQECRERFWVQNPTAYLAAGAVLSFIALLIATAWLVIEQNSVDQYIVPASDAQLKQEATGAGKSAASQQTYPSAAEAGVIPSKNYQLDRPKKQSAPQVSNPADDHYFTVRLYQENAENGNSDAQYKLGLLYLTGNGALQDFDHVLLLAAESPRHVGRAAHDRHRDRVDRILHAAVRRRLGLHSLHARRVWVVSRSELGRGHELDRRRPRVRDRGIRAEFFPD